MSVSETTLKPPLTAIVLPSGDSATEPDQKRPSAVTSRTTLLVARSQTRTRLLNSLGSSQPEVINCLPSGEKPTWVTEPWCGVNLRSGLPVCASQKQTRLSSPDEATVRPSGEK